jgi:transposase
MPNHRRHPEAFKREVCHQIRSGLIGRREAQRCYSLSDNLLQTWLSRYDAAREAVDLVRSAGPATHTLCEARIALLERKIGQLTVALEQATKQRTD